MKRASKCIDKKERYNANKIARIFLSSVLKLHISNGMRLQQEHALKNEQ